MPNIEKGQQMIDADIQKAPTLYSPTEFLDKVEDLHEKGMPPGDSTGWSTLDKHYSVYPGLFTVVTGWPGSGKSEFVDALMLNLALKSDWKFAIFSFENQPVSFHLVKLLEKMSGKRFGEPKEGELFVNRIHEEDVQKLTAKLDSCMSFCKGFSGGFSLSDVLDSAQEYLSTFPDNKRGVIIDPWNELEHKRPHGQNETEYISHQLSMVRNWCRLNKVHVWIVAHPSKMRREDGKLPIPRPDMISGSQHWWNKADCALTIHRLHQKGEKAKNVDIHVQKIRFKHIGQIGKATLYYDVKTGRYNDPIDSY